MLLQLLPHERVRHEDVTHPNGGETICALHEASGRRLGIGFVVPAPGEGEDGAAQDEDESLSGEAGHGAAIGHGTSVYGAHE